ncbi:rhomboid family intramembrane serine protease [Longimicrobium sp.]|uniref:rhomboid family intramembrane serine protease n=1 Tax=Longimicrobium sp. TaxID=2029185 RepID=UPI003B3B94B0
MIPLNDENPTELTPWMTVLLIATNFFLWFYVQGAGADFQQLEASVVVFGAQPCEITGACRVTDLGWSALLTSMFMHGGWGHILGNMLFLWTFGNNIEDSMGHVRFLVFYLVCGLAATFAHIGFSPASELPMVGASGAISGIMGAYILLYPHAKVRTFFPPIFFPRIRAVYFLLLWFVLQLWQAFETPGMGEEGGVAVWAHIGGFVAGLLLIKVFDRPRLVAAKRAGVQLPRDEAARLQW